LPYIHNMVHVPHASDSGRPGHSPPASFAGRNQALADATEPDAKLSRPNPCRSSQIKLPGSRTANCTQAALRHLRSGRIQSNHTRSNKIHPEHRTPYQRAGSALCTGKVSTISSGGQVARTSPAVSSRFQPFPANSSPLKLLDFTTRTTHRPLRHQIPGPVIAIQIRPNPTRSSQKKMCPDYESSKPRSSPSSSPARSS
jgi:hypothetical protein